VPLFLTTGNYKAVNSDCKNFFNTCKHFSGRLS